MNIVAFILFFSFGCNAKAFSSNFEVLKPTNLSVIGETSVLRLHIKNFTSTFLRSNIIGDVKIMLAVNNKSLVITNNTIENAFYESYLCSGVFQKGENMLAISLLKNSTGETLASHIIFLLSMPIIDDNLDSLIRLTGYNHALQKYFDYNFIGLNCQMLMRLILVEPKRMNIYLPPSEVCSMNYDFPYRLSANHFTVYPSLKSFSNVGFVDYTFFNLSAVVAEIIQQSLNDNRSNINLVQYVTSFIHKLTITTRKILLVFVDFTNSALSEELTKVLQYFKCNQIYFHQNVMNEEIQVPYLLDSTTVWYYEHKWSDDNPSTDNIIETSSRFCDTHDVQNRKTLDSSRSKTNSILKTEVMIESYEWGRAHIILKNACMVSVGWLMYQRHRFYSDSTFLDTRPPDELVVIVDGGTSAKKPLINSTFLVEEEDYGFLYTGMEVVDLAEESSLLFRNQVQYSIRTWPVLRGMTAASFSVQEGHIVHETEPFMQFISAAHTIKEFITNVAHNSSCELSSNRLAHNYAHIWCRLRRVIFAKLTTQSSNDWIMKMVSFVFSYFEEILRDACGGGDVVTTPFLCPNPFWHHAVYVKDHMFPPTESPRSSKGVCFEELLLLGRGTTHTSYFGTQDAARSFKEFVYRQLEIGTPVQLRSTHTQLTAVNFSEKLSFRSGERLLRITLALRPGPSRLITNLPAVTQLLLSLTGRPSDGRMKLRHLVDKDWLLAHMYPFDELSFREQVAVMAETDVFISVHGAALINGAFMKEGSVAIDILNGRFIEYVFSPPLREAGVELLYVSSEDSSRFSSCPSDTPAHCFHHLHAFDAAEIECWKIRQCSVDVDLQDLYRIVMQAYKHVRSAKYS